MCAGAIDPVRAMSTPRRLPRLPSSDGLRKARQTGREAFTPANIIAGVA
jgi:hypothetical protein